jgi:hypothetical protein
MARVLRLLCRPGERTAECLAYVLFGLEASLMLVFRQVNLDEGWYLWASKLVYEGNVLYRDFAFPQSPLLPYVYGVFQRVWGQGLYQGRLTSVLLTIPALILGARIAKRLGGEGTGLIFLLLQVTTLYAAAYNFIFAAPYALAVLLLMLSVYFALSAPSQGTRNVLATACAVLATGARLSAAAAMLPLAIYLIVTSRKRGRAALTVGVTTLLSLAIVFGPFIVMGRDVLLYDIFGFHTDRMPLDWQLMAARLSLRRTLYAFAVPLGLACAGAVTAAISLLRSHDRRGMVRTHLPELMISAMVIALFIAHFMPRTTDSYYNSLQIPLLNVLNSLLLISMWRGLRNVAATRFARYLLLAGVLFLNLTQQAWALIDRELIAFPLRNQVEIVRDAARFITDTAQPRSLLLTFDTQLAVESGMAVPPGFEMSFFGYRPTWQTAQALEYRVINNELLLEALRSHAGAAAFTDYDLGLLYGDRDVLLQALHDNYRWVKTIPGFGPFRSDNLRIYLPPQYDPPDADHPQTAQLDDGIAFLGYDLPKRTYRRGEPMHLTLYWQAQKPRRGSYTVFTHLLDSMSVVGAGQDNPPCHSTCDTESWHEGEVIRDEYILLLDKGLKPGTYTLEAGMYNVSTGERLAVLSASGAKTDDRILLGTVVVE